MYTAILATLLGSAAYATQATFGFNWPFNSISKHEKDAFYLQNEIRQSPKNFIKQLEMRLGQFDGNILRVPGKIGMRTREGPGALREAIAFLKKMKPTKPLKWSDALYLAARDHCMDQSQSGATGHTGNDGSSPSRRINKYGDTQRSGENISYGSQAGIDIIMQLFVDDGVPSRGHRTNIVNTKFLNTGVAICTHPQYRHEAVLVYAGDIKNNETTKKILSSEQLPSKSDVQKGRDQQAEKEKARDAAKAAADKARDTAAEKKRKAQGGKRQAEALKSYNDLLKKQRYARRSAAFVAKRKCRKDKACMKATKGRGCPRWAVAYYYTKCTKDLKCKAARMVKKKAENNKLAKALGALSEKWHVDRKNARKKAKAQRRAAYLKRMRARRAKRGKGCRKRRARRAGNRARRCRRRRRNRRSRRARQAAAARALAQRTAKAISDKDNTIKAQASAIKTLKQQIDSLVNAKTTPAIEKAIKAAKKPIAALVKPAKCTDTVGWKNKGKRGQNCRAYKSRKWCKNGRTSSGRSHLSGKNYKYPERNCCICGKKPPGAKTAIDSAKYNQIKTQAAKLSKEIANAAN